MNPACIACEICHGMTGPRDRLRRDCRHGIQRGLLCGRCAHLLSITRSYSLALDGGRARVAGMVKGATWRRWAEDHAGEIERYLEDV